MDRINFKKNETYYQEVHPNIWIMHNHKWALYCWEKYRKKDYIPSSLVHLDYHWDAINDFVENESIIKNMNLAGIKEAILINQIKYDSFLTPSVIRGYVNNVYFHCFEKHNGSGLDIDFIKRYNCFQEVHSNIDKLIESLENKEIILDLDLDIFNTLGNKFGTLWNEKKITIYINKIKPLIKQAKIITIAMSYGFTGNDNQIENLTKLVVPKIIKIKKTK